MNNEHMVTPEGDWLLIRHSEYDRQLRRLSRKEPKLHEVVRKGLQDDLHAQSSPEIPGLGGWIKLRLPAPTLNMGKSGAFRLIYLYLKVDSCVYLGTIYFKREKSDLSPAEKAKFKSIAAEIKKAHRERR